MPKSEHVKGDRIFKIAGRKMIWRYSRLKGGAQGWCYRNDHMSQHKEEKIIIDNRLKGRSKLNTELHEFLHAYNPQIAEDYINDQANTLASILWKLGYRQNDND